MATVAAQGEGASVTVTHAAHASLQCSPLYAHICSLLAAQFPLRNIHWRPGPEVLTLRPPEAAQDPANPPLSQLRTVLELQVNLSPISEHAPADMRLPVIQRMPMAHLFFVACDDNDVYRSQIRGEIRNWIASLAAHIPPDADGTMQRPNFLIVLVPPLQASPNTANAPAKGAMGRLYSMNKGTVLEKVRADFNSSVQDHVVYLPRLPSMASVPAPADSALWIELVARIKEMTTATFGSIVARQDAAITAYDADPAWTYSGHLHRVEQLVDTLQHVDLLEDCVAIYDALEQRLHAGHAGVQSIGGAPGDDSILLLGPLRKPYRDMIARGTISLFDLHCYLYARKSMLLGALGHVATVMSATRLFVVHVAHLLRHETLPFFVEAWSFSVALDAVEQCQAWIVEQSDDGGAQSFAFHASKTDLLELAIEQLLTLGIRVGHLPAIEPFSLRHMQQAPAPTAQAFISRKELREVLDDRNVFDSQLRNITQRCLVSSSLSQRMRHIWQLRYLLACLDMERGADKSAGDALAALAASAPRGWGMLLEPVIARQLALVSRASQSPPPALLVSALQAISSARPFTGPLDEHTLLNTLQSTAVGEVPLPAYDGIAVGIESQRARAHGDGFAFDVRIQTQLAQPVAIDVVRVCLADYRHNQFWCETGPVRVDGDCTVEAVCPMPATGFFHVQTTQVLLGKVLIADAAPGASGLASLSDVQHHEYSRARIYRAPDGDALRAHLEPSRHVVQESPRVVELVINTGRNEASEILVQLHAKDAAFGSPPFALDAPRGVELHTPGGAPFQLTVTGAAPYSQCRIMLPLVQEPPHGRLVVVTSICYRTQGTMRMRKCTLEVQLSLPLSVQIQDSFRTSGILSRLLLTAAGAHRIRARPPTLVSAGQPCDMSVLAPPPFVVFGPQEASFVLRFAHAQSAAFRLGITYRPLVLEAIGAVLSHAAHIVAPLSWGYAEQVLLNDALQSHVAGTVDTGTYALTGEVRVDIGEKFWASLCHAWGWARTSARAHTLRTILMRLEKRMCEPIEPDEISAPRVQSHASACAHTAAIHHLSWWTLELTADVPTVGVVSAVDLEPMAPAPYVVGQPIDITMSISSRLLHNTNLLKYDILCDYDYWLVWGMKKGTLQVKQPLSTNAIHIVLVPLRPGSLLFPRVSVVPIDSSVSCETYSTSAAERVDVLSPSTVRTYWAELRGG